MDVIISRAIHSDCLQLAQLELASARFEHRLYPLEFTPEQLRSIWEERLADPKICVLTAASGTELTGFICFTVKRQRLRPPYIMACYIKPGFMRCGIGTRLVAAMEKVLVREKVREIALWVEPLNYPGQEFYLKQGFAFVPNKTGHLLAMIKEIKQC